MTYAVRKADLERDRDTILEFWRKNHHKALDAKYQWMYDGNPDGRAHVWILQHAESGACVGLTALFPRRIWVNDQSLLAGIAGDLLVSPDHRTLWPARLLQKSALAAAQAGIVDFVYGFPNSAAEGLVRASGYRLLGRLTQFTKVMRTAHLLTKFGLPSPLVSLIAPLVNFVLKLASIETGGTDRRYRCQEVDDFDVGLCRVWKEHQSRFRISIQRSQEYLRWKYLRDPDDHHRIFSAFDADSGEPKAFIVYRSEDNRLDIREYVVGSDKDAGTAVIADFFRRARAAGVDSVSFTIVETARIAHEMRGLGFLRGSRGRNAYLYCPEHLGEMRRVLGDVDNWWLVASDEDT